MQKVLHRRNRQKISGLLSRTPTRRRKKTTQMRPNQFCAILIFLITPTTAWLFAHSTGTQKAAKISNKNSSFNSVHSLHTELMNASHSTNLFTNSCDHISTNGKAPLHSQAPFTRAILCDNFYLLVQTREIGEFLCLCDKYAEKLPC